MQFQRNVPNQQPVIASGSRKWFSLSLGERDGVRASVHSNCIDTINSEHPIAVSILPRLDARDAVK